MNIARITVGVDGSPASRNAVEWAVERCRMTGAELELLTVAPRSQVPPDSEETVTRYFRATADECAGWVRAEAPQVTVSVQLRSGHPADLLQLGSVAHDILLAPPAAVAVVPTHRRAPLTAHAETSASAVGNR